MTVSVSYAAEHLDELLSALDQGEAVQIERPDKPTLQLVSTLVAEAPKSKGPRVLGRGKMDETIRHLLDHWDEMDRDWKQSFRDDKFDELQG